MSYFPEAQIKDRAGRGRPEPSSRIQLANMTRPSRPLMSLISITRPRDDNAAGDWRKNNSLISPARFLKAPGGPPPLPAPVITGPGALCRARRPGLLPRASLPSQQCHLPSVSRSLPREGGVAACACTARWAGPRPPGSMAAPGGPHRLQQAAPVTPCASRHPMATMVARRGGAARAVGRPSVTSHTPRTDKTSDNGQKSGHWVCEVSAGSARPPGRERPVYPAAKAMSCRFQPPLSWSTVRVLADRDRCQRLSGTGGAVAVVRWLPWALRWRWCGGEG